MDVSEWRRPSAGRGLGWWPIDLAYGLLNPLVYLVILNEARSEWEGASAVRATLAALAWMLLVLFWGVRLTCPADIVVARRPRRALTALLLAAASVVVTHGVIDLSLAVSAIVDRRIRLAWSWSTLSAVVPMVSLWALYLVPIADCDVVAVVANPRVS